MADWYVSSAKFAALTAFQASHAYSIGDLVKATAPATGKEYVWRCTTAGTSSTEPTWSTAYANNQTIASGGATFTNVTGQSTYGWNAAAGTLYSISNSNSNRPAVGDRVFVSSDHSESFSGTTNYGFNNSTGTYGLIQVLSVNRAGSTPPVEADLTSGATITITFTGPQNWTFDSYCNMYWQGITFTLAGSSAGSLSFSGGGSKTSYLKNCALVVTNSGITTKINAGNGTPRVVFDNTTVQFGNAAQYIGTTSFPIDLTWINTTSAIVGATLPTTLFTATSGVPALITCRGVDLSAVTGTLVGNAGNTKLLLDSCRIASGVTRLSAATGTGQCTDEVELVNCWDGSVVINERHTAAGDITTDRNTYLSGGAADDVGNYSLKLASSSRSDFAVFTLDCFAFDVENTATGSSKTATVEIISSGTLNNTDINLLLEYMGTSGNPSASFGSTLSSVLASSSALTSSSNTWNSPPSTPQKQLLQTTFTPQRAGRVRGLVRLGKVSTNVWVNPQITIT